MIALLLFVGLTIAPSTVTAIMVTLDGKAPIAPGETLNTIFLAGDYGEFSIQDVSATRRARVVALSGSTTNRLFLTDAVIRRDSDSTGTDPFIIDFSHTFFDSPLGGIGPDVTRFFAASLNGFFGPTPTPSSPDQLTFRGFGGFESCFGQEFGCPTFDRQIGVDIVVAPPPNNFFPPTQQAGFTCNQAAGDFDAASCGPTSNHPTTQGILTIQLAAGHIVTLPGSADLIDSASPVPEPGTALLLLSGLAGLVAAGRRHVAK